MISIKYRPDDEVIIDGDRYTVDASFDVMLRVIDLVNDDSLEADDRVNHGLTILIGTCLDMDIEERLKVLHTILDSYVDAEEEVQYDLRGEPMPKVQSESVDIRVLDFDVDAPQIYASFMQAYGMDLVDMQGKLHWYKFIALLNGLPEDTPLKRLVAVRSWKPSQEKKSWKQQMLEAQKKAKLPEG